MLRLLALLLFLIPALASAQVIDFREETIYHVLTARFYDGDPSNNVPNEWSSFDPEGRRNRAITDPNDVTYRGDFAGLIQQLPYIQELGFTAILITPIVHNRSPLDYHGYHAWDFTRVDPRLESPGATFADLVRAVHARGMKIILDVVVNHSGRFGIKGVAEIAYNNDPNQPWGQDRNGAPLQDNPNWTYDGLTPNPDDGKIWSRANLRRLPAPFNQDLRAYNWPNSVSYVQTSDPAYFHHSGNGFAQGFDDTENLHNRALHEDTPDLNTSSPALRTYLVNAYRPFLETGVDGIRIDAAKHMSRADVLWFVDAFRQIRPNLFVVAEVAQKRHELLNIEETNPHWYTWRGATNASANSQIAVFDFFAMGTFHLFEKGEGISGVRAAARYDHLYADPTTNVTFLDNHDFGPNNDWNRRFGNTPQNLAAAMNFMFTWRGIPAVLYGTEMQFMRGAFADIQWGGHERSIDVTGRAYFGNHIPQARNHVMFAHFQKLNAMRRALPALQKGTWRWDGGDHGNGVGFVRTHGSQTVAVGLAKDGNVTFTFSNLPNGIYRDAVTGTEVTVSGGRLTFAVGASSAGVYVLNGPGRIGASGAGFFQTTSSPSSGGGGGAGSPIVSWTPTSPSRAQTVTIVVDGGRPGRLHWGVNGWQRPDPAYWPSGSAGWSDGRAVQSPLSANGSRFQIALGPFTGTQTVNRIDFVLNFDDNTWDNNGGSDYRIDLSASTSAEATELIPLALHAPAPNPTRGRTYVRFSVPEGQDVRLAVYDVLGREVAQLATGFYPAGHHDLFWETDLPAGSYLLRMEANGQVQSRMLVVGR